MDHYDYLSQINFYYYLASSNITNHLLWEHVKWTKLYLHLMYFHLHFNFIKINKISRIVCTTPKFLPRWGRCWRWVEPPTKFSKKRGLTATQFLERGCWKRRVWSFFSGGCSFWIKNKLKSEYLITNVFFSVITKHLKWEILTKNLFTFNMGVRWKIRFLWEGSRENNI